MFRTFFGRNIIINSFCNLKVVPSEFRPLIKIEGVLISTIFLSIFNHLGFCNIRTFQSQNLEEFKSP